MNMFMKKHNLPFLMFHHGTPLFNDGYPCRYRISVFDGGDLDDVLDNYSDQLEPYDSYEDLVAAVRDGSYPKPLPRHIRKSIDFFNVLQTRDQISSISSELNAIARAFPNISEMNDGEEFCYVIYYGDSEYEAF